MAIGLSEKKQSGMESYPYPVKVGQYILTPTLAVFLFSSH